MFLIKLFGGSYAPDNKCIHDRSTFSTLGRRQIALADMVLVNKVDLVSAEELKSVTLKVRYMYNCDCLGCATLLCLVCLTLLLSSFFLTSLMYNMAVYYVMIHCSMK